MASRVRLAAGLLAAAAGVGLIITITTPAGGLVRASTPTAPTTSLAPGVQVTETYTPEDPEVPVAEQAAASYRLTTQIVTLIDQRVPVVKGTDESDLARGVGLWDNDTEPGGKGNYILDGHRVTHGEPFADLPRLRPGDRVIIETASYRYVYEMDTPGDAYRVDDADLWPVDPLPDPMRGGPNRILTLITCAETFHTSDRYIAFGHLYAIHLRKDATTVGGR